MATLLEVPDAVARCEEHVARHPARVDRAIAHWLEKAARFGVAAPAFVPLRPFLLPESLLTDVGGGLLELIARVVIAVRDDPAAAGIVPEHASEVGLRNDLDDPRLQCWSRPDGFFDGATFQVTELNIGNGAAVTSIETAWLTELYQEMGLFEAVPELRPHDPVACWRSSLETRSAGASRQAIGVVVRPEALATDAWRMFEGQLAGFLERFLDGVPVGGILDPHDDAAIAAIDEHRGVFLQLGTEAMVAMRKGYGALRDPERRARWWLPPTSSLLDKNVLPLASRLVAPPGIEVPEAFWVADHLDRALADRTSLIFKSSINEKGVLFGDSTDEGELADQLRIRGLSMPLVAQRRARLPSVTIPVRALAHGVDVTRMRVWVETSPFLVDGSIAGVFCRCLPADDPRPVMSPPPDGLGLGIAVGVAGANDHRNARVDEQDVGLRRSSPRTQR